MEKRKIILFGTNSYVISLPKSWIEKNKLNKGDYIEISESEKELIINNSKKIEDKIEVCDITINKKELEIISTEIITAYLRGFDEINIKGDELNKILGDLRKIVMKLPGIEIMDLSANNMKLKNLLNENNVDLNEILKRTTNMLISMFEDSIKCFEEDIHEVVVERDNDINRMVFLSFRVLRKALKNKYFANELKLTPDKIIMLWQVFLRLEKIGDQNKRLARTLGNNEIKNKEEIKNIYEDLKEQFIGLFECYNKKEMEKLLKIATKGKVSIVKRSNSLIEKNNDYVTFKLVENFKNMSASIEQIAQILLTVV